MRSSSFTAAALLACVLVAGTARSQGLPPIFDGSARSLLPARTVAELPKQTFLENLVVRDGKLFVTSHEDGKVLTLPENGGPATVFASIPGKLTGIAPDKEGFVLTAFDPTGKAVIHQVDARGSVTSSTPVPGAIFLNGIERVGDAAYLVADSYRGVIWRFDAASKSAALWLDSPLLKRADESSPFPAANGIRRSGSEVIISNTARMTLLRVPVNPDGSAGAPSLWKERLNVDDFAVLPDGSLLAATHVYNSVVRVGRGGDVTIVAGGEQGMAGSTSVALSADGKTAYVSTNGGMFLPPPDGVQPGRVVALKLAP